MYFVHDKNLILPICMQYGMVNKMYTRTMCVRTTINYPISMSLMNMAKCQERTDVGRTRESLEELHAKRICIVWKVKC